MGGVGDEECEGAGVWVQGGSSDVGGVAAERWRGKGRRRKGDGGEDDGKEARAMAAAVATTAGPGWKPVARWRPAAGYRHTSAPQ